MSAKARMRFGSLMEWVVLLVTAANLFFLGPLELVAAILFVLLVWWGLRA